MLFDVIMCIKSFFARSKSLFALLLVFSTLQACVQTTLSGDPVPKKETFTMPSTSSTKVVEAYLKALEKQDFRKAYKYLTIGYASNLDIDGYELNMRKGYVEKLQWSLLKFEILGVRNIGTQSYVVTQMGVKYRPVNSESIKIRNYKAQYTLGVNDKKWVITGDKCIESCEEDASSNLKFEKLRPLETTETTIPHIPQPEIEQ